MRDPTRVMMQDSVPLLRAQRTHFISDQGQGIIVRWRRLTRVVPELRVNLARQALDAARRESLWATRRRATARFTRTFGGKSRWRINVACGRPVKHFRTRVQEEVTKSLTLCKHLVDFHWDTEIMAGRWAVAEDEADDDDGGVEVVKEGAEQQKVPGMA